MFALKALREHRRVEGAAGEQEDEFLSLSEAQCEFYFHCVSCAH